MPVIGYPADSRADTDTNAEASTSRVSVHVPTNLLILPPTAAVVGLLIGMSRGGSRARLRFLAENAHRQPRTVQGWYFYTKTRNYRVLFAALRTGARYAFGLAAATSLYVCIDEGVGWARERVFHPEFFARVPAVDPPPAPQVAPHGHRQGWRRGPVHWEDGAVAGGLLAGVVGITYRLPNPLMVRSMLMGVVLGSITSGLQIAQDKVAVLRDAHLAETAATATAIATADSPLGETTLAETQVAERRKAETTLVDEEPILSPTRDGWFGSLGRAGSWLVGRS